MPFSVLGDLLRQQQARLPDLPPPQHRALDAALLGPTEAQTPPSPMTMGLGFLRLIENLGDEQPVLIAVDDAQWVDGSSAMVLGFAMRRLGKARVRVIVTTRPETSEFASRQLGLDHWPSNLVENFPIRGVSLRALGQLVDETLRINLPRPVLRRLEQITGGNPYHALLVAPLLAEAPVADQWRLPVPDTPAAAILARLRRLPPAVHRDVGVFSAASPQTLQFIRDSGPSRLRRSLEASIVEGVLVLPSGRPQFSHPLIPSVAYSALPLDRRRDTHALLASMAPDPAERARHRAAASDGPDASVAADLEAASIAEKGRGAPEAEGALLELAAEMSPETEERCRRLIDAADAFDEAGMLDRAGQLLTRVLGSSSARGQRQRAHIRLATRAGNLTAMDAGLSAVLVEPSLEPSIRAEAFDARASARFNAGDLTGAIADSKASLTNAEAANEVMAVVRGAVNVAWLQTFAAPARPEPLRRARKLRAGRDYLGYGANPELVVALRHMYRDRISIARAGLGTLIEVATRRGDDASLAGYHFHAAELEIRAGRFHSANEHARLALEIDRAIGNNHASSLFAAGLTAAHLGRTDDARRYAVEGLAAAEALDDWVFRLQTSTVLGFTDLSIGDADAAAARLGDIPRQLLSHGFREPSVIPVWPNAIEALLLAGQIDRAADLLPVYMELAEDFGCPWARATGSRCKGLLAAAQGELAEAEPELRAAVDTHRDLVSPFERARTLMALGTVLRRQRQRREARAVLGEAREIFSSLGAVGWAEHAQHELARIGGREGELPGLSVTELSVARLVAEGHTNREVAAALFVAERTVEANLSRIYAKLEIRSRTELTRWIAAQSDRVPH
jgi:DNA-binding CsgD family transcriptional regulator